jgi:hypothetical protein
MERPGAKGGVAMKRLTFAAALASVTLLTAAAAEAGSATSSFGVSAEVVRRCAVDTAGSKGAEVTCVKGTTMPRIGRSPAAPPSAQAAAPVPRVIEGTASDGSTVRVSVDF